jgi:hypothetical protein
METVTQKKKKRKEKKKKMSRAHQWLTLVILATHEAEIRRIKFQTQPGQIVPEILPQKTQHKKGLVEWLKV